MSDTPRDDNGQFSSDTGDQADAIFETREAHNAIDDETSWWPEEVKETDPGREASVRERREWKENSAELAKKVLKRESRKKSRRRPSPDPNQQGPSEKEKRHFGFGKDTDVEW